MVGCEERLPGQTGRLSGQMVARAGVRSPALLFQAPGGAFLVHLGLNWDEAEGWLLPLFARVLLGHLSPRLRAGGPLLVRILLAASTWPCSQSWRDSQGSRGRRAECVAHPGNKAAHGGQAERLPNPQMKVASVLSCHPQPAPYSGGVGGGKRGPAGGGIALVGGQGCFSEGGEVGPTQASGWGGSRQAGRWEGPWWREKPDREAEGPLECGGREGPRGPAEVVESPP